jgi:uncharacterized membrane protein
MAIQITDQFTMTILLVAIAIISVIFIILGVFIFKAGGKNQNLRTDRICIGTILIFFGIIIIVAGLMLFPTWPQISACGVLLIVGGSCYLLVNQRVR